MGSPHWLKEENPYYADVVLGPIRISEIADGAETPGVKGTGQAKECLPDDMRPSPDLVAPVGDVSEAAFESGGMLIPEITPGCQSEARKLLASALRQGESGETHVVFPWPSVGPNHLPDPRDRGFFCMALPWLFPGGVGCFFDDRPFGEGLNCAKWLENLIYYYGGRFGADVACPFVALNMAHRRRSSPVRHIKGDKREGDVGAETPAIVVYIR